MRRSASTLASAARDLARARSSGRDPGDRVIWYWFDRNGAWPAHRSGEAFRTVVRRGQSEAAALARAIDKRVGARVTLWPNAGPTGRGYRAEWYEPKTERYHEGSVEIGP